LKFSVLILRSWIHLVLVSEILYSGKEISSVDFKIQFQMFFIIFGDALF